MRTSTMGQSPMGLFLMTSSPKKTHSNSVSSSRDRISPIGLDRAFLSMAQMPTRMRSPVLIRWAMWAASRADMVLTDLVERCAAFLVLLLLLVGGVVLAAAAAASGAGGGTVAGALPSLVLECSSVTSRERAVAGAAAGGIAAGGAVISLILRSSCGLGGRWTASGISLGDAAAATAAAAESSPVSSPWWNGGRVLSSTRRF
mmetsp:Transcript_14162/g.40628  ORF Transcript_14162/g.40628 Transcript_14162/m.40628 type:complete len:202 (+) Transcript_14162:3750-4355(+)